MHSEGPAYALVRPTPADSEPARVALDADQQRVVNHAGGPLLVLAGPGTGKTTTLVEAIARRIEAGANPESVLALTFSRKAAEQLRDRVTARLGRTTGAPVAATFHSFGYGLIRRYSPPGLYQAPLRLLSAPEQDVVLAELLAETPESVRWPDSLRAALRTRGFAAEVQSVLARAREKGLDAAALTELGRHEDQPAYAAAGLFLDQYLTVLDSLGATDYADLIRRATLEAQRHRAELRAQYRHVFVDEYQDTDPGQVALLTELAGDGGDLVAVGDPHQSIYAFRGAEVRGILDFPAAFPTADGSPAPVVALRTTRRFGPRLLTASQRVAQRLSLPGSIPADARAAFASPTADDSAPPGRAEVITFDSERAEAEHLADLLRRAHLEDGVPWSAMAVLVRSGKASLPGLRRSLGAAGVPVVVAADDTPLVREVAVQPLLTALRLVVSWDADGDAAGSPVDADTVAEALVSPLVGLDATELRALARRLRAGERALAASAGRPARPSAELVRVAVLDPVLLETLSTPQDSGPRDAPGPGQEPDVVVARVAAFTRLLGRARAVLDDGGTAEEVLWVLWEGTGWPRRLRQRVDSGGASARAAHRDLDALCALFETAARTEEQRGHTSVPAFLDMLAAQRIPADTLAERGVRGEAVRLLTAHRAKGLEWDLVVVAHVQEEGWPDLRRRASLLQADRIGLLPGDTPALVEPTSARGLLTEERRLFYVACTRAQRRLVVTAVASTDPDGEQASRFVEELGVPVVHLQGRPTRPLSLGGLVADLRRTLADATASPGLREAAARRLARLSAERSGARPLVPAADPVTWWGTRAATHADAPIRSVDEPITLSASALAGLTDCPAKWFLEREAGGVAATSQAQGFGNIAHALADRVARGDLAVGPDDVDVLMAEVDRVWGQLTFRTPWSGTREREELRAALARFLAHHHADRDRRTLATERELLAEVTLAVPPDPGAEQEVAEESVTVRLHGFADRLELDAEGRVVVVDLKTGKYPPTDARLAENPQLGLYQYAVEHGAVAGLVDDPRSGGAELWQLRKQVRGGLKVQRQPPQEPGESGRTAVEEQIVAAVRTLRGEVFEARPSDQCERCAFLQMCPAQQSGTVLS